MAYFAWVALCCSLASAQPKSFTILHTNDIHASFMPHEASWVRSEVKPMIGGFSELSWMVDSVRKAKPVSVLLDGGDVMTGNPISNVEYKGALGGGLFEMMNAMGYEAWTIGNHDLDISQDNLRKLTHIAAFPTVSANLTDTLGAFPLNNKPYVILKKDGLRIGVIGLMSKELFLLTNTNNLKGLKVLPPAQVAQKLIDEVAEETDVTVALTHEGVDDDSVLAVSTQGLNIIIGGHSHTRIEKPKMVNGVIICQTGANCENLGVLDVTVENHKVTSYDGKLLRLWVQHPKQDNQLAKLIDGIKTKVDQEYDEVVGTLVSDWKRGHQGESNIGDFIADAMREASNADVGITNNSGIRKDLKAGPIKKLDLFEICPFRNYLCTFTLSGKDLRAFVKGEVESISKGRSPLQLSGITCRWKQQNGSIQLQSLKVGNQDVDDAKQYTVTTSDFIITQADKYLRMVPSSVVTSNTLMFDAMLAKVKKEKSINSQVENRFQEDR